MRGMLAVITLGLWCAPLLALGATYTVSPSGNDAAAGTASAPWRTLQHAANKARAGDTVQLLPGRYAERVRFPNSGTAGQPITFVGTRSGPGGWETVIDGSTPATGWSPAPDIGRGVFQAQLGYTPGAMTARDLAIWRIHDREMPGQGVKFLARGPTDKAVIETGTVGVWDGVEALFGVRGATTYLRFRNQDHPSTMQVRAAPMGAVLTIAGRAFLTLRDLRIQGGQYAVHVHSGAAHTMIEQCYLTHGQHGLLNEASTQTTLRNSVVTLDGIGMAHHTPGDWNTLREGGHARVVNRYQYNVNKFIIGDSTTNDSRVMVENGSYGLTLRGNRIFNSMAGITFHNRSTATVITENEIFQHSDNCLFINQDSVSATVSHNLVYDCDHLMRINRPDQFMALDIYANRFWQPWFSANSGPKHLYIMERPTQNPGSQVRVYHNTFAGGGYVAAAVSQRFAFMHFRNNLISVKDISDANPTWGTFEHNHRTPLWFGPGRPTFLLPAGHAARDSAPSLVPRGWPGMTAAYYEDGKPDYGALQGAGGGRPPELPALPVQAPSAAAPNQPAPQPPMSEPTTVTEPNEPARLTMVLPVPNATVMGPTVRFAALGQGAIVGVQFFVNGMRVWDEQCCRTNDVLFNSTTVANGSYQVTARVRARDGQTFTTEPIPITVLNDTTHTPDAVLLKAAGQRR